MDGGPVLGPRRAPWPICCRRVCREKTGRSSGCRAARGRGAADGRAPSAAVTSTPPRRGQRRGGQTRHGQPPVVVPVPRSPRRRRTHLASGEAPGAHLSHGQQRPGPEEGSQQVQDQPVTRAVSAQATRHRVPPANGITGTQGSRPWSRKAGEEPAPPTHTAWKPLEGLCHGSSSPAPVGEVLATGTWPAGRGAGSGPRRWEQSCSRGC